MMLWSKFLFFFAFLGQIALISSYYPNRLRNRMADILKRYPPSEYPRLYPRPIEYYKIGHWGFKVTTRIVFLLGFVFLFGALTIDNGTFSEDGYISEIWPAVYAMFQFVPLMLLEIAEHRHFKLMREANSSSRRTAELRPRRAGEYLSARLVVVAAATLAAVLVIDLVTSNFDFGWSSGLLPRALSLIALNLIVVISIAWGIYGRKQDPHQSHADRVRLLRAGFTSLLLVSIVVSLFMAVQIADQLFAIDFLDAALISLYFQVIVAISVGHRLRVVPLENIDFEVYRETAASTSSAAPGISPPSPQSTR